MARILIVDDDVAVRTVINKLLEVAGHEVELAFNGQEGLDLYKKNPADLVITDIFMPQKDGLDTIRELRQLRADVKIIAITGFDTGPNHGYLELAGDLGAARTFTKPFDIKDLVEAAEELLSE